MKFLLELMLAELIFLHPVETRRRFPLRLLLILALSVVGVGILAARIYRVGVLLYGQPPKIGEILKMMRRRNL